MLRITTFRAIAAAAGLAAIALAGCGGGGGSANPGVLPLSGSGTSGSSSTLSGYLTVTLPSRSTSSSSSSTTTNAVGRKPLYIDTTTQNSALVATVTPVNPAVAASAGTLTVCYNLYTNGVLNTGASGNYVTTVVAGNLTQVTIGIPTPPGLDGFQITQYAGQCNGSNIAAIPTPPPTISGNGILTQTTVQYANITAGAANNINTAIGACFPQPVTPVTQSSTCGAAGGGPTSLTAQVTVSSIGFGTAPISSPVREQGAFVAAGNKIGIPIPLEGFNAAGTVVPGEPLLGAGEFPSGITLTLTENNGSAPAHTQLLVVNSRTGAIMQNPGTAVTLHMLNAISDNTITGLINACGASGTASCQDNTAGGAYTAGDPYVVVMTFDGTNATNLTSATVTATYSIGGTAQTPVKFVVTPQSAVYTAGGTGYTDLANPTTAVGLVTSGANNFFTSGGSLFQDNVAAGAAAAGATNLTGVTTATLSGTTYIYAVDQGQAASSGNTNPLNSGLYAFSAAGAFFGPVAAQAGSGDYIQFGNPVGVVSALGYVNSTTTKTYVFVIDGTGNVYKVDISNNGALAGGFQQASNVAPPVLNGATSTAGIYPNGQKYLGAVQISTGQFLIGDPGNNRIAMVDAVSSNTVSISTWASGAAFTGLTITGAGTGTSTALYATSTTGQIYYISGKGATPVSLGIGTSTTPLDGPVGQITLAPTSTPTLTPSVYLLQLQANSFFKNGTTTTGLAAPYTLAPFCLTPPVNAAPAAACTTAFAAAPAIAGLVADTSSTTATVGTKAGTINATGGILVIPSTTANGGVVTSDSLLFTDGGKLRTLVH